MRTTIATSSQCARSADTFREATTSTATNSIAKTAQIIQFATSANVRQVSDLASASMMRTGISARVATSTSGSNGVWTRPESSWLHMDVGFAGQTFYPPTVVEQKRPLRCAECHREADESARGWRRCTGARTRRTSRRSSPSARSARSASSATKKSNRESRSAAPRVDAPVDTAVIGGQAPAVQAAQRKCPYCAEDIAAEARKCRHCGEWLDADAPPSVTGSAEQSSSDSVEGRPTTSSDEFSSYAGRGASSARTGRLLKKEPWELRPDERIITRSEPYVTRYLVFWVILGVLSFGLLLIIPLWIWLYFRLMRIEWILTDRRLIAVSGWLTRKAQSVSLETINEMNYVRTFWGRTVWGTGTVVVETAATAGLTALPWAADDDPFRRAIGAEMEKRRQQLAGQRGR